MTSVLKRGSPVYFISWSEAGWNWQGKDLRDHIRESPHYAPADIAAYLSRKRLIALHDYLHNGPLRWRESMRSRWDVEFELSEIGD